MILTANRKLIGSSFFYSGFGNRQRQEVLGHYVHLASRPTTKIYAGRGEAVLLRTRFVRVHLLRVLMNRDRLLCMTLSSHVLLDRAL
jgi:hypothetical protein